MEYYAMVSEIGSAICGNWQFSERFLQILWNERHLLNEIRCCDETSMKIISPGTWNVASGPDFHNATLLFDGTLVTGDVEIHKQASDWFHHGHDRDPLYDHVILHAVWENDCQPIRSSMRTVVLKDWLHPDWCKLLWQLEDACYPYARQVPAGECSLRWALTDDQRVRSLLGASGMSRFSAKASSLMRLASDRGLDTAIYETLFETLGYKNNRLPFRRLAQAIPLELVREMSSERDLTALFLGKASLLPDFTMQDILPEWEKYVKELWECWWRLGMDSIPNLEWNYAATRPYNSPFRRLVAGIEMLWEVKGNFRQWLENIVAKANGSPKTLIKEIGNLTHKNSTFRAYRDFGHRISPDANLLGKSRLLDMMANVLLPFIAGIYEAEEGLGSPNVKLAQDAFNLLPASQENRQFKEAVHRFLSPPSRVVDLVKSMAQQQGLLDIYKNFCIALDNNCQICPLFQDTENCG